MKVNAKKTCTYLLILQMILYFRFILNYGISNTCSNPKKKRFKNKYSVNSRSQIIWQRHGRSRRSCPTLADCK